ncbi:type I-E CRISPR-associated endoribonuclease Cas2e [Bifidobacterium asteroides]|uniref:type I-E CRISPR-associated endoribonuclease Cas2e n=1 Tax=Bifidobacterium asteroides TaxID=1684 RepID=UPI001E531B0A|nr:type I-E CRISPR-associated endoribonuclease Cas2e [Bifidobacterium asteroides]
MVVVVLTACPLGLRGDLTRWLLEIASGVFVGQVTARVRDRLWERITGQIRTGKAIMVYSARNE